MKKISLFILLLAAMLVIGFSQAIAGTINFEGVPDKYRYYGGNQNIDGYYDGVNFGPNATILDAARDDGGYNSAGYPPHSGTAVLFSIDTNGIVATFDHPTNYVSFWYTSAYPFYLDVYDTSYNLITTVTGSSNYGTNSMLSYSSGSNNISYIVMHDHGNFFTIDDFTSPGISGLPRECDNCPPCPPVPEPSTLLLFGAGLLGLGSMRKRFTR